MLIAVLLIILFKQRDSGAGAYRRKIKDNSSMGQGIAIGISIGVAIGVAMGVAMDNIVLGIAIGPGMGVAIGVAIGAGMQKNRDKQTFNEIPSRTKPAVLLVTAILLGILGLAFLLIFKYLN